MAIRRGRVVVAELKTMTGRVTRDQQEWLDAFEGVLGVEAFVWRPSDVREVDRTFA